MSLLWRVAVLVAWLGALYGLATVYDDDVTPYLWAGAPLTVAVGALLDRWWVVVTPALVTAVLFAIEYASDPSCANCGEDTHGLLFIFLLAFFAVPGTIALALGIGVRRFTRFMRGMDTEPDAEYPPEPPRSPPPAPAAP